MKVLFRFSAEREKNVVIATFVPTGAFLSLETWNKLELKLLAFPEYHC
jgi:hypothetical protein